MVQLTLQGETEKYHGEKEGIYLYTESSPKGYWVHENGEYSLWWDQVAFRWVIGKVGKTKGTIFGSPNNDNLFRNKWTFLKEKRFRIGKSNLLDAGQYDIQFISHQCWI